MAGVCCCQKLGRVVKDWPTDWDMCLVWARLHVHLQWEKEVCGLVAQLLQCLYPPVQWLPLLAKSLGVGDGVPGGEGPPSVSGASLLWPCPPSVQSMGTHLSSCGPVVSHPGGASGFCCEGGIRGLCLTGLVGACFTRYQTLDSWTPYSCPSFLLGLLRVTQPHTVSSTTETSVFGLCWAWGHKEALEVGQRLFSSSLLRGQGCYPLPAPLRQR